MTPPVESIAPRPAVPAGTGVVRTFVLRPAYPALTGCRLLRPVSCSARRTRTSTNQSAVLARISPCGKPPATPWISMQPGAGT